jgi:hypothetical protein
VTKPKQNEVPVDRREAKDRRSGNRRQDEIPVADDRRKGERRKVQRRRQIDPTTCERDYTDEEIEFMQALDAYKRASGRMFPTCSEILEVIRDMGYVRVSTEEAATDTANTDTEVYETTETPAEQP